MLILVLGKGKTGSLVAEVARERGHGVRALDITENLHASALTAPALAGVDAVIDFTAAEAAVENMRAVLALGSRIVVGTTGWYAHLNEMKALAIRREGGLLYGTNFSMGVQKLFRLTAELARLEGYTFSIAETHHDIQARCPFGHRDYLAADCGSRAAWSKGRGDELPRGRRQRRAYCDRGRTGRCSGDSPRRPQPQRLCAGRGARRRVAGREARRLGLPGNLRAALSGWSATGGLETRIRGTIWSASQFGWEGESDGIPGIPRNTPKGPAFHFQSLEAGRRQGPSERSCASGGDGWATTADDSGQRDGLSSGGR